MDFIDKLIAIQKRHNYKDKEMANRIGCVRQLYQMTRTRKAPVGLTILRGAVNAFPELKSDVLFYLTEKDTVTPQCPHNQRWGDYIKHLYHRVKGLFQ